MEFGEKNNNWIYKVHVSMNDLQAMIKRLREIKAGPIHPFDGDEIDWISDVSYELPTLLDALESAIEVMKHYAVVQTHLRWPEPEIERIRAKPASEWLERNGVNHKEIK